MSASVSCTGLLGTTLRQAGPSPNLNSPHPCTPTPIPLPLPLPLAYVLANVSNIMMPDAHEFRHGWGELEAARVRGC